MTTRLRRNDIFTESLQRSQGVRVARPLVSRTASPGWRWCGCSVRRWRSGRRRRPGGDQRGPDGHSRAVGWGWAPRGAGTGRVRGAVRRVSLCGVLSPGGHDVTAFPRFPVIAECFPAVWTIITPGDGEGGRTVRLSRLPGRLTPVTWRNGDPEQEELRLISWPELRFFRRRPSDSAVTGRQGRAFRVRTSWRPVTVRRARPTCRATAPGGLASPVRAGRRGARTRPSYPARPDLVEPASTPASLAWACVPGLGAAGSSPGGSRPHT